jgi:hypothetical protein
MRDPKLVRLLAQNQARLRVEKKRAARLLLKASGFDPYLFEKELHEHDEEAQYQGA